MTKSAAITEHYQIEDILERIEAGLEKSGSSVETVTVDELSLVDEFHIGGRGATEHFFPQLEFESGERVLDIGCGIGGGARFAAEMYRVEVDGIDLTNSYIETGKILNKWVGFEDKVTLQTGDATSLDYSDQSFDSAFTMHVCMNIEDKASVFSEAYRILKPGSLFGIYDVTKYSEGECAFPLPWAAGEKTSFLAQNTDYVQDLESVGFRVEAVIDRHEFAVEFFEAVKAEMAGTDGPSPLGIHVLMGKDAALKVRNLTSNLVNGLVAPFEIIARKP